VLLLWPITDEKSNLMISQVCEIIYFRRTAPSGKKKHDFMGATKCDQKDDFDVFPDDIAKAFGMDQR
jgi:hypothetical protein